MPILLKMPHFLYFPCIFDNFLIWCKLWIPHITHAIIMYFVYIMQSVKNKGFYIGCTPDLKKRIAEHNAGKSYYSKRYAPWELIYCEGYISKKDAFSREQSLKYHAQGLRRVKERLSDTLSAWVMWGMKSDIHPVYFPKAKITCACGNVMHIPSTKEKMAVEICSKCHPFYSGKDKIIDTAGRVERFKKRLSKKR